MIALFIKLTLEGKIINKKTSQGLDSFYYSTKEIDNIQYDHSQNQLQSTNSSDINSSFLSETAPSIDKNLKTPKRESSITNSVVCLTLKFLLIILLLKKTVPISTPLNSNPIVMIRYNSRKLTSKEILSKDKLINYLMETQTTILNLVTSAKNQEKTQEKLQKLNVPQQR